MSNNIVLIGYMGSGKSAVASILAEKINFEALDLDKVISEKEGISVSQIFKEKGEFHFRKTEALALAEILSSKEGIVLSTGGGTPCFGNNLEIIKNSQAVMIYLFTGVKELARRLYPERHSRPLIAHIHSREELEEFIGKHLFERTHYYNQADFRINTEGHTAEEVAEKITDLL